MSNPQTVRVIATDLVYVWVPTDTHDNPSIAQLEPVESHAKRIHEHADCASVFWGSSIEIHAIDSSLVAVVVRWTSNRARVSPDYFRPYTTPTRPAHVLRLNFDVGDLREYPVTEIALPCFPSDMSYHDIQTLTLPFRAALMHASKNGAEGEQSTATCALGLRQGWVASPDYIADDESLTGEATVCAMFIGWSSIEAHMDTIETERVKGLLEKMTAVMLPFAEGLELSHFVFKG
ncbi:hypothetical protein B0T22DRAFT_33088 [Podospora appendiculata]|uniref:Uncharacterized protein n=1 Tax=Podospora appendiculata TaxID=314037 RepID=A0AAE0XGM5_9PEZI|nr:hypothetical protein B0T22DRAFT_33088 [Podospora appendiculata]